MDTAGLLGILFGIYLLTSAIKNRRPIDTIKQIVEKPGSIRSALNSGDGYIPSSSSAFDGSGVSGGGSGGGSASTWSSSQSATVNQVVSFAMAQRGKPYVWGGLGTNNKRGGYDCSGLVYSAYKSAGITIPRTTATMLPSSRLERITKSQLQAGDLVFPFPGHVQLYIGNGRIVEAPGRGRNVQAKTLGSVWQARRVKALYKVGNSVVV